MWWENPHAEVQEPKKAQHKHRLSWAATFRTELHMNRSANETNQNVTYKMVVGFFGFSLYGYV